MSRALFFFLQRLPNLSAAGDASGLGRQICWEAASHFDSRFLAVNFSSKKSDLGFALMNQLASAQKRFPRSEQDIAADFFALRKACSGTKWTFSESRNSYNPASHCDIAWAAALASHAHINQPATVGAMVVYDSKEEQSDAENDAVYGWSGPPTPGQMYPIGCAVCAHRPAHFKPPPQVCQKCGIYLPKN